HLVWAEAQGVPDRGQACGPAREVEPVEEEGHEDRDRRDLGGGAWPGARAHAAPLASARSGSTSASVSGACDTGDGARGPSTVTGTDRGEGSAGSSDLVSGASVRTCPARTVESSIPT